MLLIIREHFASSANKDNIECSVQSGMSFREGHDAMVRAWRSADVAVCRAVSNPAREISCFSPLNLGTLLRWCVLGQDTSPSNASLDSGENGYLVGQRWQCVR